MLNAQTCLQQLFFWPSWQSQPRRSFLWSPCEGTHEDARGIPGRQQQLAPSLRPAGSVLSSSTRSFQRPASLLSLSQVLLVAVAQIGTPRWHPSIDVTASLVMRVCSGERSLGKCKVNSRVIGDKGEERAETSDEDIRSPGRKRKWLLPFGKRGAGRVGSLST